MIQEIQALRPALFTLVILMGATVCPCNVDASPKPTSGVIQAKRHGLKGDGVTDDSAALNALLATLGAEHAQRFRLVFEDGVYPISHTVIPFNVSIEAENRRGATLRNTATDGGVFITMTGSYTSVRGLVIDAQRSRQPLGGSAGKAALVAVKPGSPSGGGEVLAGGLTLSAPLAAGDRVMNVTSAMMGPCPVVSGDMIALVEGTHVEHVRVHQTYTDGNRIPLTGPVTHPYTPAAKVSCCVTHVLIEDNLSYGAVEGQSLFAGRVVYNEVRDAPDTCMGLFDGGSISTLFGWNDIETDGHWGVFLDRFNPAYPINQDIRIEGNTIRFIAGYVDPDGSGGAVDGIGVNNCLRTVVVGNTIDLTKAGIRGIRINPGAAQTKVYDNTVLGRGAPETYGIAVPQLTTADADPDIEVTRNHVEGFAYGIDLGIAVRARVKLNTVRESSVAAINGYGGRTDGRVQHIDVADNDIEDCPVGVRFSGKPAAGGTVRERGNTIRKASFAPVVIDEGWTVHRDPPQKP